jgi:hypothetical protein
MSCRHCKDVPVAGFVLKWLAKEEAGNIAFIELLSGVAELNQRLDRSRPSTVLCASAVIQRPIASIIPS